MDTSDFAPKAGRRRFRDGARTVATRWTGTCTPRLSLREISRVKRMVPGDGTPGAVGGAGRNVGRADVHPHSLDAQDTEGLRLTPHRGAYVSESHRWCQVASRPHASEQSCGMISGQNGSDQLTAQVAPAWFLLTTPRAVIVAGSCSPRRTLEQQDGYLGAQGGRPRVF